MPEKSNLNVNDDSIDKLLEKYNLTPEMYEKIKKYFEKMNAINEEYYNKTRSIVVKDVKYKKNR